MSETFVVYSLQPGHYRLTSDFVGTKLDRRLSGKGWRTKEGFASGTRFTIKEDPSRGEGFFVLEAPYIGYVQQSRVYGWRSHDGSTDIIWAADSTTDMLRVLRALVPDTSSSTWLSHAIGRTSSGMGGYAEEILLGLLDSGRVTKEEIEALYQQTIQRLDSEK